MEFVLEFERPIVELQKRIEALRAMERETGSDLSASIDTLRRQSEKLQEQIFSSLSPWQRTLLSRHPGRPYTMDYAARLFTDWTELHGDRAGHDDRAIVTGLARFRGRPVVVIGHQKGRNTKENLQRNFGMPRPEGYRKALRAMQLGARFGRPILCFIDTPGAYPGVDAEERGQAEAIARNIMEMSTFGVPVLCAVIGEGGSGGALAIGVGNRLLMLENSVYSVISPEGCASILWKTSERAADAAEALGITAHRLKALGLVDKIVNEPVGGAHRNVKQMCAQLKRALNDALRQVSDLKPKELLQRRYERLQSYGRFTDTRER
jgi:acetyl-CoA carboxylase carboxyl transferase subunit alpha